MKFDGPDPQRIDELEPSELGDLVRSARLKGPSGGALGRMTQNLAAGGALTAGARTATSRAGLFARLGGYTLGALVMMGLAGALFVRQTKTSAPPPLSPVVDAPITPKAPPQPPVAIEAPSISVEALPSPSVARSAAARPAIEPPPAVAARAPSPTTPASSSNPSKPTAPFDPSSSPEVEFAIVRRAQDALVAEPSRALAIVEEHARLFPSGELVQEREVVAVEALARLGRHDDAKSRAGALLGRFPRTPYVARLERALGEPITLPSKTPR